MENKDLEEITFENTIFEGNDIILDGVKGKITSVKHNLPKREDGGFYSMVFKSPDGSVERYITVSQKE